MPKVGKEFSVNFENRSEMAESDDQCCHIVEQANTGNSCSRYLFIKSMQRMFGVDVVGEDHRKSNIYIFLRFISIMGDEGNALIAVLFWFNCTSCPTFIYTFGLSCLFGQYLKDIFQIPRPTCDKSTGIRCLEEGFNTEYGMPSTHVITSFLPSSILIDRYIANGAEDLAVLWVVALLFPFLMGISRMYLGVHSFSDVLGGVAISVAGILFVQRTKYFVLNYLLFHHLSPYIHVILLLLFLVLFMPKPPESSWRASFGSAAQFFGTFIGCSSSTWFIMTQHPRIWQTLLDTSSSTLTIKSYMQLSVLGIIVSASLSHFVKEGCRYFFISLLSKGYVSDDYPYDVFQRPVPSKYRYCVDIASRIISLQALCWSVIVLTPCLWNILGLI